MRQGTIKIEISSHIKFIKSICYNPDTKHFKICDILNQIFQFIYMKGSKNLGYLPFVVFSDRKKYFPIFGSLPVPLTINLMGHEKSKINCM